MHRAARCWPDQTLFQLNGQQVLGSASDWVSIQWLAWVDVINLGNLGGSGDYSRSGCLATVAWTPAGQHCFGEQNN